MNELEKQLGWWTPRHPSARLERRLFAAAPAPAVPLLPFRSTWLAPVTGTLALVCVLFNQRYVASLSGSGAAGPMVAMILSNQSAAAYLPGSVRAERNNLPADAFEWRRHNDLALDVAYPPRAQGNKRP